MDTRDLSGEFDGRSRTSSRRVVSVYGELKRRILANEFAFDAVVSEQELADLLQVSRSPVREALLRLEIDELVAVHPGQGMRVLPISADDMREIFAIVGPLEAQVAAELAQRGLSTHEFAPLRLFTDEMAVALEHDDLFAWAESDDRFHRTLVALSANRRLRRIVSQFWEQSHRVRMFTLARRAKPTQSVKDHDDLLEAILARDPDRARAVHMEHRANSARALGKILSEM